MIRIWINMIHANRIGADSLHERSVETALRSVDQWVVGDELVRDTYEPLDW